MFSLVWRVYWIFDKINKEGTFAWLFLRVNKMKTKAGKIFRQKLRFAFKNLAKKSRKLCDIQNVSLQRGYFRNVRDSAAPVAPCICTRPYFDRLNTLIITFCS